MCACGRQELTAEAADYGITWGLEVVNRYESNILNTASKVRLGRLLLREEGVEIECSLKLAATRAGLSMQ